jgi:arylsulfatase A-like enzyme
MGAEIHRPPAGRAGPGRRTCGRRAVGLPRPAAPPPRMTTRREFLGTLAGGLALGALAGPRAGARPPGAVRNLLFIAIDDINDWIGPLGGHPGVHTPNIDRLAASALTFTRAYTAVPVCAPSRASLLTGAYAFRHGLHSNDGEAETASVLAAHPELVPFTTHFRRSGWRVESGGKVFHGRVPDPDAYFDEFRQKPGEPEPPNPPLNGIPGAWNFDWGPLDLPDIRMGDGRVAEWAVGRLARPQPDPFVLVCGFYRPHLPWYAPRPYFDLHPLEEVVLPAVLDTDLEDVPPTGQAWADAEGDHATILGSHTWAPAVQGYLASISFVDAQVGRVLDALEASPHAADTAVVLWSDHGFHLGEKLHWRKFALWEEATRIPLIVRVPGLTPPGARCERTVSSLDLYPTFNALFGLPPVSPLDGRDLGPLLADPARAWEHPAVSSYLGDNFGVRSERWRYIRYVDGTEELYDHDADPLEWTNLADDPVLEGVKRAHAAHIPTTVPTEPGPPGGPDGLAVYPNPTWGGLTFAFYLLAEADLTLSLYDLMGRLVYRKPVGPRLPGSHRLALGGAEVPLRSGSYLCRLHGPGFDEVRRVLFVR